MDDSVGKTYVCLSDSKEMLIGYYNITTGSLQVTDVSMKFKIGGTVHINAFAVDNRFHGKIPADAEIKYSDFLLNDCMSRIYALRKYVGFSFVTLSSTESGYNLYKRNGFEELESDMAFSFEKAELGCTPMYFPLDSED